MATTIKVIWTPEDSIPGNNKGTLSWTSNLAQVRVFNSATKQMQNLPSNHKLSLNLVAPAKGTQTYCYTFFNGTQQKPLLTMPVRVSSQPLIFARWIPTYEFNKTTGARNGIGTLKINARGVTSVKIFGQDIAIPPQFAGPGKSYEVPFNLPTEIALVARDPSVSLTAELIINVILSADGVNKNVKINLLFA
jgi:hypothetical protein